MIDLTKKTKQILYRTAIVAIIVALVCMVSSSIVVRDEGLGKLFWFLLLIEIVSGVISAICLVLGRMKD